MPIHTNLRIAAVLSMAVVVCLFLFHGDVEAEVLNTHSPVIMLMLSNAQKETVISEQVGLPFPVTAPPQV